ncbi:MAG: FtsW/RodA/SpoVE family cell cycle protein, partial [Desulfobacterales bacterium]|nr:FtsW/RodA/SpoVE family cell cycle protein [Desulfobacterales bacterium]
LLERLAYPVYVVSLALLVLVLLVGKITSGSQRWLSLGGISFQVSEMAKIVLVLTLAKYFSERGAYTESRLRDLWQPLL